MASEFVSAESISGKKVSWVLHTPGYWLDVDGGSVCSDINRRSTSITPFANSVCFVKVLSEFLFPYPN